MSVNCSACGQSPVTAGGLDLNVNWFDFYYEGDGYSLPVFGIGQVEKVTEKTADVDSYGYVEDSEIWMIVKVGDRYFKKEGTYSSYGGAEWNGSCREVKAEPKTITVFDYL